MKLLTVFCMLACMYGHMMQAVFVRCAELVNDAKKKVILCDDMHLDTAIGRSMVDQYCEHQVVQDACEAQQKSIEHGMDHLLHDLHSKTSIITETNLPLFFELIEQECKQKQDNADSLWKVARYLIRYGMQSKEKSAGRDSGFAIHKNLSWIIGDQRNSQDVDVAFLIPTDLYRAKMCWETHNRNGLLTKVRYEGFETVNIGFVKHYVRGLRNLFVKKEFHDPYGQKLLAAIDAIVEESGLRDNDHFVYFHDYFARHKPTQDYMNFFLDMLRFNFQPFDLELRDCCDAFMKSDNDCDTTIITAGLWHTKYVQEYLLSKGFRLVDESSTPVQTSEEAESELFLKSVPERIERCNKLLNELISTL